MVMSRRSHPHTSRRPRSAWYG